MKILFLILSFNVIPLGVFENVIFELFGLVLGTLLSTVISVSSFARKAPWDSWVDETGAHGAFFLYTTLAALLTTPWLATSANFLCVYRDALVIFWVLDAVFAHGCWFLLEAWLLWAIAFVETLYNMILIMWFYWILVGSNYLFETSCCVIGELLRYY